MFLKFFKRLITTPQISILHTISAPWVSKWPDRVLVNEFSLEFLGTWEQHGTLLGTWGRGPSESSVSSGSHGQGAIRVFPDSGGLLCHREKTAWKFLTDLSVGVLGPTLQTWAGNQLGVRIGKEKDHLWGNSVLWFSHLSLLWLGKHPPPQGQVFSPSLFQKSAWKGCGPLDPPSLWFMSASDLNSPEEIK